MSWDCKQRIDLSLRFSDKKLLLRDKRQPCPTFMTVLCIVLYGLDSVDSV